MDASGYSCSSISASLRKGFQAMIPPMLVMLPLPYIQYQDANCCLTHFCKSEELQRGTAAPSCPEGQIPESQDDLGYK